MKNLSIYPQAKSSLNLVSREFFQVSLVTYLLLTLAETLKEGFVSNFFNMNYLLLVVLATGVAMVLTEPSESELGQARETVKDKVQEAATVTAKGAVKATKAVRRRVVHSDVIDLRKYDAVGKKTVEKPRPKSASKSGIAPASRRRQLG